MTGNSALGLALFCLQILVLSGCNRKYNNGLPPALFPDIEINTEEIWYEDLDNPFVLPEPPKYFSDPIVDGEFSRDRVLTEVTDWWIEYWTNRGSGDFAIFLKRMGRYSRIIDLRISLLNFLLH